MGGTDELPPWVAPQAFSVRDLTFLALQAMGEGRAPEFCAGVVAAAGWVQGLSGAPVTSDRGCWPDPDIWDGRLVEAESWAAGLAGDPKGGLEMTEVCRVLNVPLRIPLRQGPNFAAGVFVALRWMLGMDEKPPMALPWRTPEGKTAGAPYIYARLLAEAGPLDEPGEARLRATAKRRAEESRQLVTLIRRHLATLNSPPAGEAAS
jgi:hypothetical protein